MAVLRKAPGIGLALLIFVGALAAYGTTVLGVRPLQDLSPGARFDVGPYVAGKGCPAGRWSVGQWLPAACIAGNDITHAAELVGLEPMHRRRREKTNRLWARNGPDALAVVCIVPFCRINKVVRDRFVAAPEATDPEVAEFWRAQPPRTPFWVKHLPLMVLGVVAVGGLGALIPREKKRAVSPAGEN